ncbi:hypothetical protein LCGC14_2609730 [marine sediment metagenome]|uniref:Uncharacterized protein n=1 Tax=marine sediment metagenome TaxID=412755 RepID=A0A0F9A689_9ZZZZ
MANFEGDSGSLKYAGNAVGELLSWSISGLSVGVIEDSAKGDANRTYKGGRADGGVITARCQLDYGDTNGQKAWADSVVAGTGAAVTCQLLTATGKYLQVTAIPTGLDMESPEGESITQGTFTGKVTGLPAWTWA